MMKKAGLIALIGLGLTFSAAAQTPTSKRTELTKGDLTGTNMEVIVGVLEVPPRDDVVLGHHVLAIEQPALPHAHLLRDVALRGHGIVAVGDTVQQATVAAVNLNELCAVTLELARLGANPPVLSPADLAELPDLGGHFNDELVWRSLVADLGPPPLREVEPDG